MIGSMLFNNNAQLQPLPIFDECVVDLANVVEQLCYHGLTIFFMFTTFYMTNHNK